MIEMNLEGGKELERMLLALETKVARKVVRKGVRKGLKPTLTAAKSNALSMMGSDPKDKDEVSMRRLLNKNIVLRAAKKQRKGSYMMRVQLRPEVDEFVGFTKGSHTDLRTRKLVGTRHYIPAAIEYGHGNAAAVPFMRTAADANLKKAVPILRNEMVRGIEAIARK